METTDDDGGRRRTTEPAYQPRVAADREELFRIAKRTRRGDVWATTGPALVPWLKTVVIRTIAPASASAVTRVPHRGEARTDWMRVGRGRLRRWGFNGLLRLRTLSSSPVTTTTLWCGPLTKEIDSVGMGSALPLADAFTPSLPTCVPALAWRQPFPKPPGTCGAPLLKGSSPPLLRVEEDLALRLGLPCLGTAPSCPGAGGAPARPGAGRYRRREQSRHDAEGCADRLRLLLNMMFPCWVGCLSGGMTLD